MSYLNTLKTARDFATEVLAGARDYSSALDDSFLEKKEDNPTLKAKKDSLLQRRGSNKGKAYQAQNDFFTEYYMKQREEIAELKKSSIAAETESDMILGETEYNVSAQKHRMTSKAMKEIVVREAKLRNMDPTVAVKVFGGEALNSSSYQSDIPREGKGSLNSREASFGPTQLYTGGGLGNTYEKMTGRYLTDDNNPVGITKQIQFALDMAIKGGWHQWSAAKKLNLNKRAGLSNAKQVNNWRDE